VQVTTLQTNATEKKDRVMTDVSSVLEIILRITRDVRSTRTYKRKHTHLSKQYTPPAQIKQALHTQPVVTYTQITKQNSYAATNIEQDLHINLPLQQTSDMRT
jgi:hypothetical protein